MPATQYKDPVRSVNTEVLSRLEMVSDHVSPLPGGTGRRLNVDPDPRLTKLQDVKNDEISYYEHVASVRDKRTSVFYVAFRETADALFARSQDPEKFPELLMKSREKLNERMIFVYRVYRHPKDVPILRSHEDWLTPITDPSIFDAVVYFLSKNNVLTDEQYRNFK